jgi:uncharacterized membrane protein YdjX (TVP38/TMEM64 family)
MAPEEAAPPREGPSSWRRWLPLLALLGVLAAVYASGLHRYLSYDTLAARHEALAGFVAANPLLAPLAYIAVYALSTALSLPGALFLTLAGGFLFGTLAGGSFAVLGATAGATGLFLIARTALGAGLRQRAGPWLNRMERGFREDAFSYLLVLRLIPLVPFWLVNLVPAFLGVPLATFAAATFIGILPATFVYAGVGDGLGVLLEEGQRPDLGLILRPQILLPLLGLALLALLPVAYKRLRHGRRDDGQASP